MNEQLNQLFQKEVIVRPKKPWLTWRCFTKNVENLSKWKGRSLKVSEVEKEYIDTSTDLSRNSW